MIWRCKEDWEKEITVIMYFYHEHQKYLCIHVFSKSIQLGKLKHILISPLNTEKVFISAFTFLSVEDTDTNSDTLPLDQRLILIRVRCLSNDCGNFLIIIISAVYLLSYLVQIVHYPLFQKCEQ